MPRVSPFVGLQFDPAVVGPLDRVTSPPYDTIASDQERELHDLSPHNVVRLILGREEPGDDQSRNKYTRAAQRLRSWRADGVLAPTEGPAWFVYEMTFSYRGEHRRVRGLICAVELEPWGGSIIPHERTMPAPIQDRLALLRQVQANLSPVYALARGPNRELASLLGEVASEKPRMEVADEAGVEHRMWVLRDGREVPSWLEREQFLIADGHHRYAVALAYRDEMRARAGPGPWDSMMMLVVDAGSEDPPVLPIHRVLLSGSVPAEGHRVRDLTEVLSLLRDDELTYGTATAENGRVIHRVATVEGEPPVVCALHEQMLDKAELLFVPDAVTAEEEVRMGHAPAAVFLPPTRVERIRSVIEHDRRMPQKSTYFWPKPRTGSVIRPLEAG